jgi:outer membrane protein TolC
MNHPTRQFPAADQARRPRFDARIGRLNGILGATALVILLAACEPNPNPGKDSPDAVRRAELATTGISVSPGPISLNRFAQLLAETDEAILAQGLEVEIAKQSALATAGAFEPVFYAELNRTSELSQTSAADFLARGSGTTGSGKPTPFEEVENRATVGMEFRNRSGVTLDLYYEMSEVRNSLQAPANRPSPEYFAAAGLSVKVPLLRNGGRAVNTSNEVIAHIDEQIAQETTRLVTSQRAYDGVTTYLLVQRAQARVRWRERMANLATALEREMENQVEQGLRPNTALIEAQGERAQRASDLAMARQELSERLGAFQIYFTGGTEGGRFTPSDPLNPVSRQYLSRGGFGSVDLSFSRRPEARINSLRVEREELLRLVAENQAKAEANLILDYRKSQLDGEYIPFRDVFSRSNPYDTWRIGFEYRRGLLGDISGKAELEAAKLREQQAELTMTAFRNRISSELNGIGSILARATERLAQQDRIVKAQRDLLAAEESMLQNGQSSQVDVIARRIAVAQAQELRVEALVQLNLASYLASQVDGTLLKRLGILN